MADLWQSGASIETIINESQQQFLDVFHRASIRKHKLTWNHHNAAASIKSIEADKKTGKWKYPRKTVAKNRHTQDADRYLPDIRFYVKWAEKKRLRCTFTLSARSSKVVAPGAQGEKG